MFELDFQLARLFLEKNNFKDCQIIKIAGDASFRSYYRILYENNQQKQTAILMYAPKNYENIEPFIKIDKILLSNNFSAPNILAIDNEASFILLEDFGDETYTKLLQRDISLEFEIYKKACDVLINLHKIPLNSYQIAKYNNAVLYREVSLFLDWYLPYKNHKISLQEIRYFKSSWINLFDKLNKDNQVLVLRDYHADNLMILQNRNNFKSVGLLDFQDALIGSNAYDLLSLLEDARRDVAELNRQKLFDYFISQANYNYQDFLKDYEIISLQRNIKILGIFARLYLRDGKSHYLNYIPRVEKFVRERILKTNLIDDDFKKFLNNYF